MTPTGHDEEFRRLFEEEARTRLAALAEQAMELESRGADEELVAAMFRNVHTLKGGAGVVGLVEIADVLHELEQLIEDVRSGHRIGTPAVGDAVLRAVDALTDMVGRALAGQDQEGARVAAMAALARADAPPTADAPADPGPTAPQPAAGLVALPAAAGVEPRAEERESIPVPVARLDALVRLVGEGAAAQLRVGRMIAERTGREPTALDEYRELVRILRELQEQAMRARMVSVATVARPLRRAVRDLARAAGKQIRWELLGEETELDRHVLERLREPLVALVRNAIDHGIELADERVAAGKDPIGRVSIHAMQVGAEVIVSVSDDGRGIDPERVRAAVRSPRPLSPDQAMAAIFRPGVSTAETVTGISGRGVGLDAVRAAVDELRGRVEVRSVVGAGTEFRIGVPMTLAVLGALLVRAAGEPYAIPLHAVIALLAPGATTGLSAEGRPAVWAGGDAVALADLGVVLGIGPSAPAGPVVVVSTPAGRHAFRVDELVGQRDVVVKELSRVLPRIDVVAGASVEPDGRVLVLLDPGGLIEAAAGAPPADTLFEAPRPALLAEAPPSATILVVDDALTIRELQRSILERAGYAVATAVSADDALARLEDSEVDLVLTDIEMPGIDGFELTRAIRASAHGHLPILVLTTRASDEDRRRGMEAGADGYLVKSTFDEHALLTAVRRLLGDAAGGATAP